MLEGCPPGTKGAAFPTGWMTQETSEQYLDRLIKETRCSLENKVLLILDNHEGRYGIRGLQKTKDNCVILLPLPPHCSHRLQPLDVTGFGPFKTFYNQAADNWMVNHPGTPITIFEIAELIGVAFPEAFTPTNVINGFDRTRVSI